MKIETVYVVTNTIVYDDPDTPFKSQHFIKGVFTSEQHAQREFNKAIADEKEYFQENGIEYQALTDNSVVAKFVCKDFKSFVTCQEEHIDQTSL